MLYIHEHVINEENNNYKDIELKSYKKVLEFCYELIDNPKYIEFSELIKIMEKKYYN